MSPMARQRASMVLAPEVGLELGEGHFDWVQVRAVWRQEEEPGAALPEDGLGLFAFMRREVVEDDGVAGLQHRGELRSRGSSAGRGARGRSGRRSAGRRRTSGFSRGRTAPAPVAPGPAWRAGWARGFR